MFLITRTTARMSVFVAVSAASLALAACAAPAPIAAPAANSSIGTGAKAAATVAPKAQPAQPTTAPAATGAKAAATVMPNAQQAQPTLAPAATAAAKSESEAVKPSTSIVAPAIQTIAIKGSEYMFNMPDQIQAGLVTINWENDGKEVHQAQFARLNDGVTADQFQAALKKSPDAALPLVTLLGGPGAIDPGGKQSVVLDLPEGQYFVLCFVQDAKGVPHLAEGMIHQLKVVAAPNAAKPAEPKADSTIGLKDFAFTLPKEIKAGAQTWKVFNEGPQPHELALIKLKDGKTEKDALAFMQKPQGSAPFESVGGMQALSMGKSAWAMLDLKPGNYVALCYVPDPKTGKPHAELGMITSFTVK